MKQTRWSNAEEQPSFILNKKPIPDVTLIVHEQSLDKNLLVRIIQECHTPYFYHKFIIGNIGKYSKKFILRTISNFVYPAAFRALHFTVSKNKAVFLSRNCQELVLKICSEKFRIANPECPDSPFKVIILANFILYEEVQVEDNSQSIIDVITKRFNSETETVDLNEFSEDEDLKDYYPLFQMKFLLAVTSQIAELAPKHLNLQNNCIRDISNLHPLRDCIESLDLCNNMIEDISSLMPLINFKTLKSLSLTGNPFCGKYDNYNYVLDVKKYCQNLEKLDGFDVTIPVFQKNFFCSQDGRDLAKSFLEHFFTVYDSRSRQNLIDLYDKDAIFSVTAKIIPNQKNSSSTQLDHYGLKIPFALHGATEILKLFKTFPKTYHDPYPPVCDVTLFTDTHASLTVGGIFKELQQILSFTRHFVFKRAGDEFRITNEQYHVSNASDFQVGWSFGFPMHLENCGNPLPYFQEQYRELEETVHKITNMNYEYSQKYLDYCQYDLRKTLHLFSQLHVRSEVPENAFTPESDESKQLQRAIPPYSERVRKLAYKKHKSVNPKTIWESLHSERMKGADDKRPTLDYTIRKIHRHVTGQPVKSILPFEPVKAALAAKNKPVQKVMPAAKANADPLVALAEKMAKYKELAAQKAAELKELSNRSVASSPSMVPPPNAQFNQNLGAGCPAPQFAPAALMGHHFAPAQPLMMQQMPQNYPLPQGFPMQQQQYHHQFPMPMMVPPDFAPYRGAVNLAVPPPGGVPAGPAVPSPVQYNQASVVPLAAANQNAAAVSDSKLSSELLGMLRNEKSDRELSTGPMGASESNRISESTTVTSDREISIFQHQQFSNSSWTETVFKMVLKGEIKLNRFGQWEANSSKEIEALPEVENPEKSSTEEIPKDSPRKSRRRISGSKRRYLRKKAAKNNQQRSTTPLELVEKSHKSPGVCSYKDSSEYCSEELDMCGSESAMQVVEKIEIKLNRISESKTVTSDSKKYTSQHENSVPKIAQNTEIELNSSEETGALPEVENPVKEITQEIQKDLPTKQRRQRSGSTRRYARKMAQKKQQSLTTHSEPVEKSQKFPGQGSYKDGTEDRKIEFKPEELDMCGSESAIKVVEKVEIKLNRISESTTVTSDSKKDLSRQECSDSGWADTVPNIAKKTEIKLNFSRKTETNTDNDVEVIPVIADTETNLTEAVSQDPSTVITEGQKNHGKRQTYCMREYRPRMKRLKIKKSERNQQDSDSGASGPECVEMSNPSPQPCPDKEGSESVPDTDKKNYTQLDCIEALPQNQIPSNQNLAMAKDLSPPKPKRGRKNPSEIARRKSRWERSTDGKWRRSRSRSADRSKRSRSRSADRSKRSRSRSADRSKRSRSRSADRSKRSRSRSADRSKRSRSRSADRSKRSRSRSADRRPKRSPNRSRRNRSRSRSRNARSRFNNNPRSRRNPTGDAKRKSPASESRKDGSEATESRIANRSPRSEGGKKSPKAAAAASAGGSSRLAVASRIGNKKSPRAESKTESSEVDGASVSSSPRSAIASKIAKIKKVLGKISTIQETRQGQSSNEVATKNNKKVIGQVVVDNQRKGSLSLAATASKQDIKSKWDKGPQPDPTGTSSLIIERSSSGAVVKISTAKNVSGGTGGSEPINNPIVDEAESFKVSLMERKRILDMQIKRGLEKIKKLSSLRESTNANENSKDKSDDGVGSTKDSPDKEKSSSENATAEKIIAKDTVNDDEKVEKSHSHAETAGNETDEKKSIAVQEVKASAEGGTAEKTITKNTVKVNEMVDGSNSGKENEVAAGCTKQTNISSSEKAYETDVNITKIESTEKYAITGRIKDNKEAATEKIITQDAIKDKEEVDESNSLGESTEHTDILSSVETTNANITKIVATGKDAISGQAKENIKEATAEKTIFKDNEKVEQSHSGKDNERSEDETNVNTTHISAEKKSIAVEEVKASGEGVTTEKLITKDTVKVSGKVEESNSGKENEVDSLSAAGCTEQTDIPSSGKAVDEPNVKITKTVSTEKDVISGQAKENNKEATAEKIISKDNEKVEQSHTGKDNERSGERSAEKTSIAIKEVKASGEGVTTGKPITEDTAKVSEKVEESNSDKENKVVSLSADGSTEHTKSLSSEKAVDETNENITKIVSTEKDAFSDQVKANTEGATAEKVISKDSEKVEKSNSGKEKEVFSLSVNGSTEKKDNVSSENAVDKTDVNVAQIISIEKDAISVEIKASTEEATTEKVISEDNQMVEESHSSKRKEVISLSLGRSTEHTDISSSEIAMDETNVNIMFTEKEVISVEVKPSSKEATAITENNEKVDQSLSGKDNERAGAETDVIITEMVSVQVKPNAEETTAAKIIEDTIKDNKKPEESHFGKENKVTLSSENAMDETNVNITQIVSTENYDISVEVKATTEKVVLKDTVEIDKMVEESQSNKEQGVIPPSAELKNISSSERAEDAIITEIISTEKDSLSIQVTANTEEVTSEKDIIKKTIEVDEKVEESNSGKGNEAASLSADVSSKHTDILSSVEVKANTEEVRARKIITKDTEKVDDSYSVKEKELLSLSADVSSEHTNILSSEKTVNITKIGSTEKYAISVQLTANTEEDTAERIIKDTVAIEETNSGKGNEALSLSADVSSKHTDILSSVEVKANTEEVRARKIITKDTEKVDDSYSVKEKELLSLSADVSSEHTNILSSEKTVNITKIGSTEKDAISVQLTANTEEDTAERIIKDTVAIEETNSGKGNEALSLSADVSSKHTDILSSVEVKANTEEVRARKIITKDTEKVDDSYSVKEKELLSLSADVSSEHTNILSSEKTVNITKIGSTEKDAISVQLTANTEEDTAERIIKDTVAIEETNSGKGNEALSLSADVSSKHTDILSSVEVKANTEEVRARKIITKDTEKVDDSYSVKEKELLSLSADVSSEHTNILSSEKTVNITKIGSTEKYAISVQLTASTEEDTAERIIKDTVAIEETNSGKENEAVAERTNISSSEKAVNFTKNVSIEESMAEKVNTKDTAKNDTKVKSTERSIDQKITEKIENDEEMLVKPSPEMAEVTVENKSSNEKDISSTDTTEQKEDSKEKQVIEETINLDSAEKDSSIELDDKTITTLDNVTVSAPQSSAEVVQTSEIETVVQKTEESSKTDTLEVVEVPTTNETEHAESENTVVEIGADKIVTSRSSRKRSADESTYAIDKIVQLADGITHPELKDIDDQIITGQSTENVKSPVEGNANEEKEISGASQKVDKDSAASNAMSIRCTGGAILDQDSEGKKLAADYSRKLIVQLQKSEAGIGTAKRRKPNEESATEDHLIKEPKQKSQFYEKSIADKLETKKYLTVNLARMSLSVNSNFEQIEEENGCKGRKRQRKLPRHPSTSRKRTKTLSKKKNPVEHKKMKENVGVPSRESSEEPILIVEKIPLVLVDSSDEEISKAHRKIDETFSNIAITDVFTVVDDVHKDDENPVSHENDNVPATLHKNDDTISKIRREESPSTSSKTDVAEEEETRRVDSPIRLTMSSDEEDASQDKIFSFGGDSDEEMKFVGMKDILDAAGI